MEPKLTSRDILASFSQSLKESRLVNSDPQNDSALPLLTSDMPLFFERFFSGASYRFISLFEDSRDSGKAVFSGKEIVRKKIYDKSELTSVCNLSPLAPDKIASCRLKDFQEAFLAKRTGLDSLYVSYADFYYHEKDSRFIRVAPLLFFKVSLSSEGGSYYLRLSYHAPLFNTPLFSLLSEQFGLDLSGDNSLFSLDGFLNEVKKKSDPFGFAFDDTLRLIDEDVLGWLRMEQVVEAVPRLMSTPLFRFFDDGAEAEGNPSFASAGTQPSFISSNLAVFSKRPICKIEKESPASKAFLKQTIHEYLLHKKNIWLAFDDPEDERKARKELIDGYYDAFMAIKDLKDPSVALFSQLQAVKKKPGYLIDSSLLIKAEKLKEEQLTVGETVNKLRNLSIPAEGDIKEIYVKYLACLAKASRLYDFSDISEYDYDDYLSDQRFLTFAKRFPSLEQESFTAHPFYGLNSDVRENQYEDIMDFIRLSIKDIADFKEIISKAQLKLTGWSDFNSIRDFDDTISLFTVFSEYDGFPLSYFDIDFTPELLSRISNLKEFYRLEASIKLSIDVLCRPEIWNSDFKAILEKVRDRQGERRLRKELKPLIKISPFRKSFKTFIVLIDKYEANGNKISQILPSVREIIGSAADSLDGLLEFDREYEFIQSFLRHKRLYDYLSFSNHFVQRIFSDARFVAEFKGSLLPELLKQRSVIEHDMDKYHAIFNEDKFDFVQSSFDDDIARLNQKLTSSFEVFGDYLSFSKKADESSKPLRKALDAIESEKGTLKGFEADYMASLYRYLLLKAINDSNGLELIRSSSEALFSYYRDLAADGDPMIFDVIRSFDNMRNQLLERPSFSQIVTNLKNKYHYTQLFSPEEALKIGGDLFFHLYPLYVSLIKDSGFLSSQRFDLAIVKLSPSSGIVDLFSALIHAESVIVIGDGFPLSAQLPSLDFRLDADMEEYKGLDRYPDCFVRHVEDVMTRHGLSLERGRKIDDMLTVPYSFEKRGERFALCLEDGHSRLSEAFFPRLSDFLRLSYGIRTVFLYPLPFIVYDDLSILSLSEDVTDLFKAKDGSDVSGLTYEQQKKLEYYQTLDAISASFPPYDKPSEELPSFENSRMASSTAQIRPIMNISYFEIAKGIIAYLSHFTYLSRDTLIKRLSAVVGTDEKDIDFRQLFLRSENFLLEKGLIKEKDERLALVR